MSDFSATAEILNSNGLHARPAGKIVALANSFECEIKLQMGDKVADARSIIDLMTLTAACGSIVEISASGEKSQEAVEAIVDMIQGRFEEE